MPEPLRIAILGAESTGKTQLAQQLAAELGAITGLACTWVPEHLRAWCDAQGRTPRVDEQTDIALQQQTLINAAAQKHAVVVCDTTPLMTAVYSAHIFNDDRLLAAALAQQRGYAITLLTALDVVWQADGLQRDGPLTRQPVDNLLRTLLSQHGLPWALVSGQGTRRLASALAALAPLLPPSRQPPAP